MTKLEAIEYLKEHSVYTEEWTGAGMWEAVCKVLDHKGEITTKLLEKELETARNF